MPPPRFSLDPFNVRISMIGYQQLKVYFQWLQRWWINENFNTRSTVDIGPSLGEESVLSTRVVYGLYKIIRQKNRLRTDNKSGYQIQFLAPPRFL